MKHTAKAANTSTSAQTGHSRSRCATLQTTQETIKHQTIPLLLSELAGCIVGVVSVVIVAELFRREPRGGAIARTQGRHHSIAMEVASVTGGIPPLTSAVVICTGIFGSIVGFRVLQLGGVKSSIAAGLSIGTAAHAIGTAGADGERFALRHILIARTYYERPPPQHCWLRSYSALWDIKDMPRLK